jgi:hypothetical protein
MGEDKSGVSRFASRRRIYFRGYKEKAAVGLRTLMHPLTNRVVQQKRLTMESVRTCAIEV